MILLLGRPELKSGISLCQILTAIPAQEGSSKPLFHATDRQWRLETSVNFCFLLEHKSDARTLITGLVPFVRDMHDPWYISTFSSEAKLCHKSSWWHHTTRQVFSADEAEISDFLVKDDELNHTNTPTKLKPNSTCVNPDIEVNNPTHPDDVVHHIQADDDSVPTFHQGDISVACSQALMFFQPRAVFGTPSVVTPAPHTGTPRQIQHTDNGSISISCQIPPQGLQTLNQTSMNSWTNLNKHSVNLGRSPVDLLRNSFQHNPLASTLDLLQKKRYPSW